MNKEFGSLQMRNQPVPVVDMEDVKRVVHREYPPEVAVEILQRIALLDVREKARVVLACLKVAKGDHVRLERDLEAVVSGKPYAILTRLLDGRS